MEKTYEQKVHYKIVIEGDYSIWNMWYEDLRQSPEDFLESLIEYLSENPNEVINNPNSQIELTNLRTIEE